VRFRIAALLVCWAFLVGTAPGPAAEVVGGEKTTVKLNSRILGEERTLSVILPDGYRDGGKAYPVLYVLDAESKENLAQAITAVSEIRAKRSGPEMIVVGVRNTDRNRDMIPAAVSHRPGSGGSREFLAFFREELLPLIGRSYRTSGFSVLYGASNSGLFAVYALLESPQTFNATVAASPMIGHCPEFIRGKSVEFLRRDRVDDRTLYMIYGTEDSPRVTGFVPEFQKALEAASLEGFRSRLEILDGEGHVPPDSLRRGLLFVFGVDTK
jgi:predicted alpha/beta superfamily hydrolase